MRKRFLMIILVFVLVLSGSFLLTACGDNNNDGSNKEIAYLYIKKDGSVSDQQYINIDYGKTIGEIGNEISLVFKYSDGSEIEFNVQNFSADEFQRIQNTYQEQYYVSKSFDYESYQRNWETYDGSTDQDAILDVGDYKVEISLNGKTALLFINVMPSYLETKNVAVVVLKNENNDYIDHINSVQTYNYGMPAAVREYNEEDYASDYKIYVLDKDKNNEIISGSDVTQVKALPLVYDGSTISTAFPDIAVGTNMLDFYNAISEETESDTFDKKQLFLGAFGINITTGYNYSDDTLIVDTEALRPGNYRIYVYYQNQNYNGFYTEPTTELNVGKGVFNLKKAIRYSDQEWSEDNAEEILSKLVVSVNYTFSAGEPLFNENNTKALTAKYLNDNAFVQSNAQSSSAGEVFNNVDFEIAGGGYTGFYGKFILLEKNQYNQDIRFDATDNGSTNVKVVFVLDSDWSYEYYNDDPTVYDVNDFEIQFNINKGQVYRPYTTADTLEREYTGSTISIVDDNGIIVRDPNAVKYSGTASATAINTYTITYSLIDEINYEFIDVDSSDANYGDNGSFTWAITKLELINQWGDGFTTKTVGYNGTNYNLNQIDGLVYEDGVRTFTFSIGGNDKYDLLLTKLPGRHINWAIDTENTYNVIGATVSQAVNSDVVTVTFTRLSDNTNHGYVHLNFTINETEYSKEVTISNNLQIVINKKDFSEEQKAAILNEIGAEACEPDGYHGLYKLKELVVISNVAQTLPNILPDYSDENNLPETASLGRWKLYYYINNESFELHNGDHVDSSDLFGDEFIFVPADDMYNGFMFYLAFTDYEFVNEDIPADVLTILRNEFENKFGTSFDSEYISTAIITDIYADSTGYGTYEYFLPVHDNEAEGAFQGRWVLCFDGHSGDYEYDVEISDHSSYSYGTDSEMDAEYIKSQDRNWRVKFIPSNTGYNEIEIKVNVVFS